MKVLCVNASIDPESGGGTAERTLKLSINLQKRGFEVSVLTTTSGYNSRIVDKLKGIDVYAMPLLNVRHQVPRFNPAEIHKLIESIDIVHLMNHWTVINAITYAFCRFQRKPYVICPAGALPIFGRSRYLKAAYNRFVGKPLLQHASGHIAITSLETGQFEPYGIEKAKVTIIPNGINPDEFTAKNDTAFRSSHGLGDVPYILFLGRLNPIKGPDLLLHAFTAICDRFPDHHLVYAGPDGGMLPMLREIARKKKIEGRVHFIGFIGGDEKSWAYYSADLLVVPSRQEAMSIVAIESGITGTPVLMTDVCGLDQIAHIGGGLVVPPSVDGLREGLLVLQDTERLAKMGKAMKRYVEDNFTWDTIVDKHIDLFNRILGSV